MFPANRQHHAAACSSKESEMTAISQKLGRILLSNLQYIREARFRSDRHYDMYKSAAYRIQNYFSRVEAHDPRETVKELRMWAYAERLVRSTAPQYEGFQKEDNEWLDDVSSKLSNLKPIFQLIHRNKEFALRALHWVARDVAQLAEEVRKREEGADLSLLNRQIGAGRVIRGGSHRA